MFDNCSNCGATLQRSDDGRVIQCHYCGAKESTTVDPQALAASLHADKNSVEEFLERFAHTFADSFPDLTEVESSGLIRKRVEAVAIVLDPYIYRLRRDSRRIVAERQSIVRGITLKTEQLKIDGWIDALCATLSEMATGSERARAALKRLGS